MKFPELVRGRLLKRYKRFLADVELVDGSVVTAHCANPGSMKSILEPAPEVWLSRARPDRKLAFTWEVAVLADGTRVYVNPTGANRVVRDALDAGGIPELLGYDAMRPEVKYGTGSRIDFLLAGEKGSAYVEVKNVTLGESGGRALFPDSVTTRGTKHLLELLEVVKAGHRGVLLFCVSRTDAVSVAAASEIDAVYAKTLAEVSAGGVEVLAYGGDITEAGFSLSRSVPVLGL